MRIFHWGSGWTQNVSVPLGMSPQRNYWLAPVFAHPAASPRPRKNRKIP